MADITSSAASLGREATAKARAFTETNAVAKKAKDVVYTAVGLGVIGAQKATTAVKHVHGTIDTDGVHASVRTSVDNVTTSVRKQAANLDTTVAKTMQRVDTAVAPVEEKLPAPVRQASAKAREATTKAAAAVSSKFADGSGTDQESPSQTDDSESTEK
jgi:hypothetical protein